MNQKVKAFNGYISGDSLARAIEKYATENNLKIEHLSYAVGLKYDHALVVFVPIND